ncbi:MAG: prolyl oligopeptidase family serine peptidase [Bdellovibrionales bacterium]|nr:prolyl oligopeptidase family serine peptidase [Massilia sp.]
MKTLISLLLLAATAGLAGCGGKSPSAPAKLPDGIPPILDPGTPVFDYSPARGTLVQSPPPVSQSLTQSGLSAAAGRFGSFGAQLMNVAGSPQCGIDIHQIEYATVGATGEPTHASAALMVPSGSAPACTGKRPLLLYGHGSSAVKDIKMGSLDPAAPYSQASLGLAALFAAQGYVVLAPNYAGYDSSPLPYHPHQIAEQMGMDMIDAVAAARKALPKLKVPVLDNGKLFLTGYSEGGYAAMAAHRAMQAAGISVTASAPSSGTYAQAAQFEALLGQPNLLYAGGLAGAENMLGMAIQFTAWQKAYGNLYASPSELYSDPWAASMETLAPIASSAIPGLGSKLPPFLMSKDLPNVPALSTAEQAMYGTPATSLLKTSYFVRLLADIAAVPCPATSNGDPLACPSSHAMRRAWFKNDLRSWTPTAPMLMCGGHGDGKVPFMNAQLTAAYFQAHGVAAGLVSVLDVDSASTANDPYAAAKASFAGARQIIIASGGNPDSVENYHGFTAFSGCSVAARDFFARYQ